jgi:hypothetical protein
MGGVNMIMILLFIEKALAIAATFPKYKLGCSGDNGFCDCIGLIIGALKRAGVKWKGIHGSNYAARYRLKGKIKRITSVKDLKVGDLVFKAVSTIDLDEKVNQAVTDLQTSEMYFNIAVSLPGDVPDGEYAYSICMGDSVLSSGLLVIGENTYPSEYDKDITYEQYSSE